MRLRIVVDESLGRGRRDRRLGSDAGAGLARCARSGTRGRKRVNLSWLSAFLGTVAPPNGEKTLRRVEEFHCV